MEKGWEFPKKGFVKINVHAVTLDVKLQNGNDSGIGIVLRDHEGTIIYTISGTIRDLTVRGNEMWSLLVSLRSAFYEGENKIQLETDNVEALKEWEDWRWFLDPNHSKVIQQLEQRRKDPNLQLEVKGIHESQNRLARYLAEDGALNRTRLVVFRRHFGRVKELWKIDMGLGYMEEKFQVIEEDEYSDNEIVPSDWLDLC